MDKINRTFAFVALAMCLNVYSYGQATLSIALVKDSPRLMRSDYETSVQLDLAVENMAQMSELVVAFAPSGSAELKVLHKLAVSKRGDMFFLNNDQPVINGVIRYTSGFPKAAINANDNLAFYAIAKSGESSNVIIYSITP